MARSLAEMQGYKRFENPTAADESNPEKSISDAKNRTSIDPSEGATAINFAHHGPEEQENRRNKHLQAWKFLRASAAAGLLLATCLVILESFIDFVVSRDEDSDNFGVCGFGTGIWVGILGIVAGILGICSFRTIDSKKSVLVAHLVFLVMASIGDGIMIIVTAFCVDALPYVRSIHEWDHEDLSPYLVTRSPGLIPIDMLLYAVGALTLLLAFIHSK